MSLVMIYYYLFLGKWFENIDQYRIGFTFLAIWLFAGLFNSQFVTLKKNLKFWNVIGIKINAGIVLLSFTSLLVYTFLYEMPHIKYFIIISFIYTSGTVIAVVAEYIQRKESSTDEVNFRIKKSSEYSNIAQISEAEQEVKAKYFVNSNVENHYLSSMLSDVYMKKFPKVFHFIKSVLDLAMFDIRRCVILRSSDVYNVEVLPEDYLELYTNLHQVNDIRRINEYFINVNSKLAPGGIFIIPVEPLYLRRRKLFKRYPYVLGRLFYFLDFIWKRFCPKIPFIKRVYFALTKGSNRVLSLAETLGRLYYCGFEVIATREINDFIYIISRKIKEPVQDKEPSYGPLFKMKRIGLNGKIIYVYKLRTMHPYSEYLQKFVFKRNQLQAGGKLKDDFRVTDWGSILRKFWIDELPMLINWVKGDLKFVGVRPLSQHYLNLYTTQLKEKRKKYKPGLVPPFYADLPKTLEEIMYSEERYLEAYDKHPFLTDVKYFFRAFRNIIFRHARSA
jgi:lipopolysaccharide/colanic/teichoic acid biosynthesis glycosyltransferase